MRISISFLNVCMLRKTCRLIWTTGLPHYVFSLPGWGCLCPSFLRYSVPPRTIVRCMTFVSSYSLNQRVTDSIFSNVREDKMRQLSLIYFMQKQSWALVTSKVVWITQIRAALIQFTSWRLLMFPWRNFYIFVCLICDALLFHFNIPVFSCTCLLGECLRNPFMFIWALRRINAGLLLSKIITFYN